jgi:hypothetical protein
LTIRYGPLSTCPPSQSSEPNCPDWLKKCECVLLRAALRWQIDHVAGPGIVSRLAPIQPDL